jgi:DNA repair protein NreA
MNDIYKAKKSIDFTSKFDKELKFKKPLINDLFGMSGGKNEIINLELNMNVSISNKIEKYTQGDTKSKEAVINLYEKGFNESQIINLLSLGNFGIDINKRCVPTRWTISAYDKIIESFLYDKIKNYKVISNYEFFFYEDKGNKFLVILIPDVFSFENIEFTNDNWQAVDYVKYNNKLNYKEPKTAGGFFASKVAILEYLRERKKQASIVCLRLIDNYEIPLGVVFVRESLRESMKNNIYKSSNMKDVKSFVFENYFIFFDKFLKSNSLKELNLQKKINDFF